MATAPSCSWSAAADVTARDARGWTPLHFACFAGLAHIVDLLLLEKSGEGRYDRLAVLVPRRVRKFVRRLHRDGSLRLLPVEDDSGTTPFQIACINGHAHLLDRYKSYVPSDKSFFCVLLICILFFLFKQKIVKTN